MKTHYKNYDIALSSKKRLNLIEWVRLVAYKKT